MTTTQLHLELDLLLQKINSHYNKNITPYEKDFFINNAIASYINTRINPRSNFKGLGFDESVKRTEELNPLVVTKEIDVVYGQDKLYYDLPLDYKGYINSSVCLFCSTTEPYQETFSKFSASIKKVTTSFENESFKLTIVYGSRRYVLFDSTTLPEELLNRQDTYSLPIDFMLNNTIDIIIRKNIREIKAVESTGLFKSFEYKYNKDLESFDFKANLDFYYFTTINGVHSTPIRSIQKSYQYLPTKSTLYAEGNLVERDYLRQNLNNSLSGNNNQSVICTRDKNRIILYKNARSKFFPTSVELIYIKQPSKVSAILNSNSELEDDALREILHIADRNIKGLLSMDSYEKTLNEFTLIE